jgi:hypothetical protein
MGESFTVYELRNTFLKHGKKDLENSPYKFVLSIRKKPHQSRKM